MVLFREPHGAWQKPAQPHFTPDSEDVIPIPAASIYRERSFSSVRSLYNNLKMGKILVRQRALQAPNYSDLSHCCFVFFLKRLRTRRTQQNPQGWSARTHESSIEPAPPCQQPTLQQTLMPDCSKGKNTRPQEDLVSGVGFVLCCLGYFFLLD